MIVEAGGAWYGVPRDAGSWPEARVTVEEALLAVVGVVAVVLLFFGLVDVLEGDVRARLRARRRRWAGREGRPRDAEPLVPRAPRPPLARRPGRAAAPAAEAAASGGERRDRHHAGAGAALDAPGSAASPRPEADDWRDGVARLLRRREWGEARRLIDPALVRGDVSPETAGALLGVCVGAVARDLWRLRRALRRGPGDEAPLAASMEATRVLLDSPPAAALPLEEQRRVGRWLWRGHTRLGLRRWRAGRFEGAVETLFQALAVRGIDERRGRLARDLLVRTLEDMAGQSLEVIPQLLDDGDRAAALEQAQHLLTHIRRAREEGVPAEDLAVAASRARQLLAHIEQAPAR
jgi:hypothetical protein